MANANKFLSLGMAPALANAVADAISGGGGGITSNDITDATTTGKAVLTAASQAAARTAIGAGTSSLALGTTSTTAMAGDKFVQAAAQANSTATDVAGLVTDFNALLAKLRTAKVIAP